VVFRALLGVDTSQALWIDTFDAYLSLWILEWGFHALTTDPLNFWNANVFYPHSLTLAYAESHVGMQLLYTPLRAMGVERLTACYVALAAYCLIPPIISSRALARIGSFSAVESMIVLYAAHFSMPMVGYFSHYQIFAYELSPPFFLYLFLFVRDRRLGDLHAVCALFSLALMGSVYLAPLLLSMALPLLVVALWYTRASRGFWAHTGAMLRGIGVQGWALVALYAVLCLAVQLWPYALVAGRHAADPSVVAEEVLLYSARPWSLLVGFSIHSLWYDPGGWATHGSWESAYFPGLVLLGGAGVAAVSWLLRGRGPLRSDERAAGIGAALGGFAGFGFVCAWVLSWGPRDPTLSWLYYPFAAFAHIVPALDGIRAPGRFGAFLGLFLGLMLVHALRASGGRAIRGSRVAAAVLGLLVIDSIPQLPTYEFSQPRREVYRALATHIDAGEALIELPVARETYFDTLQNIMFQMNGSIEHWGRLLVGYAGTSSPEHLELGELDYGLQHGRVPPEALIAFARRKGVRTLVIHLDDYHPPLRARWQRALAADGADLRSLGQGSVVARLDDPSP
jgi:hypothetical protein